MKMKDLEDFVLVSRTWRDQMIDLFESSQKPKICARCGDAFSSTDETSIVCHECEEAIKYDRQPIRKY